MVSGFVGRWRCKRRGFSFWIRCASQQALSCLCSVDAFSSRWLLHCLVVTAASCSTHFSWFQNGGPPGKHFPMNSLPQRARGRISRKIHRRVHTATSLTFSEPWPGPQQGLHLSPGELWGEALSQPWGGHYYLSIHELIVILVIATFWLL